MKMTKGKVRELRDELSPILEAFAKEKSLAVSYQGGNYDDTNVVMKFEFAMIDEDGNTLSREATNMFTFWIYTPIHYGQIEPKQSAD